MAIADNTRKILWSTSGNKCSICKCDLTLVNDNKTLVICEECHIISKKENGPRHKLLDKNDYDNFENLILLCPNDHLMIDKDENQYTIDRLVDLKNKHLEWVRNFMAEYDDKNKENYFYKIVNKVKIGSDIIDSLSNTHSMLFSSESLNNQNVENMVANLFDSISEYSNVIDDVSFKDKLYLGRHFDALINKLKNQNTYVYTTRLKYKLLNNNHKDSNWIISVFIAKLLLSDDIQNEGMIEVFSRKIEDLEYYI